MQSGTSCFVWRLCHCSRGLEHVQNITSKANRILGLIKRNFWFCTEDVKKSLYTTLVRPKVEYATPAWDPHFKCDVEKIEQLQRSAARFCTGDYHQTSSVTIMITKLQLESLEKRRKIARLLLMYKIIHDIVDVDKESYLQFAKEQRTRNSHKYKLQIQRSSKDVFKYSFFIRTATDWNSLPANIVLSDTLDDFKRELIKHFE